MSASMTVRGRVTSVAEAEDPYLVVVTVEPNGRDQWFSIPMYLGAEAAELWTVGTSVVIKVGIEGAP